MTQGQGGEEGEGQDGTEKLEIEWGTGFNERRFFPLCSTKTSFSSFCEGQTEGRVELGVALGFSMGGAARWRLLSAFSRD